MVFKADIPKTAQTGNSVRVRDGASGVAVELSDQVERDSMAQEWLRYRDVVRTLVSGELLAFYVAIRSSPR
jgi:hypothetical protein